MQYSFLHKFHWSRTQHGFVSDTSINDYATPIINEYWKLQEQELRLAPSLTSVSSHWLEIEPIMLSS